MRAAILLGALGAVLISTAPVAARVLTPSEKAIIREAVLGQFLDPDTAKFRWLPLPTKLKGSLYCGSVNAKNGFGAYTGYQAFAVVLELKGGQVTKAVSMTAVREYDADVWRMLCAEKGMDISLAR
jgi:hypothetical protein